MQNFMVSLKKYTLLNFYVEQFLVIDKIEPKHSLVLEEAKIQFLAEIVLGFKPHISMILKSEK